MSNNFQTYFLLQIVKKAYESVILIYCTDIGSFEERSAATSELVDEWTSYYRANPFYNNTDLHFEPVQYFAFDFSLPAPGPYSRRQDRVLLVADTSLDEHS